jgi:ABC-2 type transport system ATP-binding protein
MLETHGLTRQFGAKVALDGLTISIESAESFALLGPNGAGKTTTIKILTTLLSPSSGSATVSGRDIVRGTADVLQKKATR